MPPHSVLMIADNSDSPSWPNLLERLFELSEQVLLENAGAGWPTPWQCWLDSVAEYLSVDTARIIIAPSLPETTAKPKQDLAFHFSADTLSATHTALPLGVSLTHTTGFDDQQESLFRKLSVFFFQALHIQQHFMTQHQQLAALQNCLNQLQADLIATEDLQAALHQKFDLSTKEARLAINIAHGLSPNDYAVQVHRSVQTVRTQLKTVYRKMQLSNQKELVTTITAVKQETQLARIAAALSGLSAC